MEESVSYLAWLRIRPGNTEYARGDLENTDDPEGYIILGVS